MKTLYLNLKKQWFDMIKTGEKTEEYRDIKDFWFIRFENKDCRCFFRLMVSIAYESYKKNCFHKKTAAFPRINIIAYQVYYNWQSQVSAPQLLYRVSHDSPGDILPEPSPQLRASAVYPFSKNLQRR